MLRATKRDVRQEWLAGAVLLGIVIAKLMLVDSADGGGLAPTGWHGEIWQLALITLL